MADNWTYKRSFCEVCGERGGWNRQDGSRTCEEHFHNSNRDRPLFDRETGERFAVGTDGSGEGSLPIEKIVTVRSFTNSDGEVVVSDSPACRGFFPGHMVHWVQARRSWDKELGLNLPCVVTNCDEDGWLTVRVEGEPDDQFFWNHDPEKGRALIGRTNLLINTNYSLITSVWAMSSTHLSVSTDVRSCVLESPEGLPHEQMESHGGFTISGPEALRIYRKGDEKST